MYKYITALTRAVELLRRGKRVGRAAALVLLLATLVPGQTPGVYQIDPKASLIEIHVFKSGLFGGFADNHVIQLTRFSGTAETAAGAGWQIHVLGESGSLKVVDPSATDSTRAQVQEKMLGAAQIDATQYPVIELRSRSLSAVDADKTWQLAADLTVHGVTRQVEFPLAWSENAGVLHVRGKKQLLLRDFSIEPIRLGLGTVKVRSDFELAYDIVLRKQ